MSNEQCDSNGAGAVAASLAEAFDELTSRVQGGEVLTPSEVRRRYPAHAEELLQLLPALAALDDLSAAEEPVACAPAQQAPELLGDFRIVGEVGRGGMGIVYEAEQVSLKRRVALKVLPFAATLDARQVQRFRTEAQAAGLHHSNIVPIYQVGSERGTYYHAMQFIDGHTLAAALAQLRAPARPQPAPERPPDPAAAKVVTGETTTGYTPPSPSPAQGGASTLAGALLSTEGGQPGREYFRAVARLGVQAAEALDYAHQLGIVHRDVKPANLMVDGQGRLWVTDFGLARIQSEASLTATGDLVGTLRYMSPEQALAKRVVVDHRTDIYSLGATLYEMLALRPAFAGKDREEVLRQIAFEEPARLRCFNKRIPVELETIVLKAMEKNPADRYATAQELADDLRNFQEDRPIRARRPSLGQRARRWARRHRAAVTATLLCLGWPWRRWSGAWAGCWGSGRAGSRRPKPRCGRRWRRGCGGCRKATPMTRC
jgi:serine/threonine protein kinase